MVSIIIPVYNACLYLERCLQSVISQTYVNWECILIDDGSTDDSGKICDIWQQRDNRIRVIHQSNQGASLARQVGIKNANGYYLSFIDADDVVETDYIEKLRNALVSKDADIAACDFIRLHENQEVNITRCNKNVQLLDNANLHQRFFNYEFWGYPGKMYKKSLFNKIYFPKATINEDYVVMAQLFNVTQHMAYIPIALYHYMTHENSLSHQKLSKRMMEEWENKKWVITYYQKIGNKQWERYATIQAAETCCKLISAIKNGVSRNEYDKEKREMQKFLCQHLFFLLTTRDLLLGLKLMCLKNIFN